MNETIEQEIHTLLNKFWVLKEENPEVYYSIKRHQETIRDFIIKNLGSKFIIHEKFIKLEKIPATPEINLGLPNFKSPTDYSFLCLILLFLEDKTKGTYFMLSNLIEYVKNTAVTLELNNIPNWTLSKDRKSLSRAIDFLISIGAIELKDGGKLDFKEDVEAEALYTSTGLSNYVMRLFSNEIFSYTKEEDFINDEWTYQSGEKGDVRKYKVYRNLIYTPLVLQENLNESETDYLKKLRGHMKEELENNLGYELEVTKNMAFVFESERANNKETFPNNKKISDIVLMVNQALLEKIEKNEIMVDEQEIGILKKEELFKIIIDIKRKKIEYLSKYLRDQTDESFFNQIVEYMEHFSFLKETNEHYKIYPSIRIFISKIEEEKNKQLEIWRDENV